MFTYEINSNEINTIISDKDHNKFIRVIDRYFGENVGKKYSADELSLLMSDGLATMNNVIQLCVNIESMTLMK